MNYDCSNRVSTSMSMTLGCQSSTLRRKDLKKCLRMHTHISKKVDLRHHYSLVHTSMTNYKMNHSETWSLVFHQWSIPSEFGTKVKQVIHKSLSQYVRLYGMAKDMISLAFPSCSFIQRCLNLSKYEQVWLTSQARKQQTLHTTLSMC